MTTHRLGRILAILAIAALLLMQLVPASAASPARVAPVDASELLITEVVVTPTAGEFIEIHNPTGSSIDLSDVYVTDATYAPGNQFYYNIVNDSLPTGGGEFADFNARFPEGASIGPGEYQTIALNGAGNFAATYGVDPTYELYATGGGTSVNVVAVMREARPGSINGQGGLSNDGEVVILYYWDGQTDLVTDLDYVLWGDKAEAVDKTGITIDGPDPDTDGSTYQADTAIADQDVTSTGGHSTGDSWQRADLTEGNEVKTGGNGVNGNDETSEDLSNTFCTEGPTPNAEGACPTNGEEVDFGTCGDGEETLIHVVQGDGLASPFVGEIHVVEAVVVGDYQAADELKGFFLQEEDEDFDGNLQTSEGLFVYDNGFGVDVNEGNVVRVKGEVDEFSQLTQLKNITDVAVCSTEGPAASVEVVSLPLDTLVQPEPVEGMLVTFEQTLYVSENYNLGRFGEMVLSSGARLFNPTDVAMPGDASNAVGDSNDLNRIVLDDGSNVQNLDPIIYPAPELTALNTVRSGDSVTGLTGVLSEGFGVYRIQPTEEPTFVPANPRPQPPQLMGGVLKVASFNVLNYFTTIDTGDPICGPNQDEECRGADSEEEFVRQRAKIINAIAQMNADVVGLMELENTPGASPLADLVAGLNGVTGPGAYAYIDTGVIGTGHPIKVGFIYKTGRARPIGGYAILDSSVDPTFDDTLHRPALAQTFEALVTGGRITLAVNHFKSKGSCPADGVNADQGDGQSCWNAARNEAAAALVNWLEGDPTGTKDPDYLILGDLNSYAMEDPITTIKNLGYTDLVQTWVEEGTPYTYVFFGEAGVLDHMLGNQSAADQVTDLAIWHINADEPNVLAYDVEFKNDDQIDKLYSPNPYRSSDHDPVIVCLWLPGTPTAVELSELSAASASGALPGAVASWPAVVAMAGLALGLAASRRRR